MFNKLKEFKKIRNQKKKTLKIKYLAVLEENTMLNERVRELAEDKASLLEELLISKEIIIEQYKIDYIKAKDKIKTLKKNLKEEKKKGEKN